MNLWVGYVYACSLFYAYENGFSFVQQVPISYRNIEKIIVDNGFADCHEFKGDIKVVSHVNHGEHAIKEKVD